MPVGKISVLPRPVAQTEMFRSPSQALISWERIPDVARTRIVEALAQLLLRASDDVDECEEEGDD